jgi:DNA helicase-2/ATP-dependent DNA helicase PcrA
VNPADSFSGLSTLALIPGISAVRAIAIYNAVKCCGLGKLDRLPKMPTKGRSSLNRIADLARQVDRSSAPTKKTVKDIAAWLRTTLACELTQTDETLLVQAALKLADWRDFLDFIAHSLVDTDDDRPDDRLTISTIHAAKGREWEIVRILNVVAGQIPYQFSSRATVEEERRILFVAMSRAKSQLEMYVPTHIAIRGRYNSDVSISPFISSEIERCCKIG